MTSQSSKNTATCEKTGQNVGETTSQTPSGSSVLASTNTTTSNTTTPTSVKHESSQISVVTLHNSHNASNKPIVIKDEPSEDESGPGMNYTRGVAGLMGISRPSTSGIPLMPGISGMPAIPGTSSIAGASSSNTSDPSVTCSLCGNPMCGKNGITCASDDEEEEAAETDLDKDKLPPPPMSSVEVDKLFSKLIEQDKETPLEPAAVITTEMHLHQKQALNWMVNRENSKELGPFWKETNLSGEWYNEGTRHYLSERPNCIKGGILADDMGLGKTLTVIALIFTNHINGKPLFLKKEVSDKKRKASENIPNDSAPSQPKKVCAGILSSDEHKSGSSTSCISISSDDDKSQSNGALKLGDKKPVIIKRETVKKRRETILNNNKKNKVGTVVKKEKVKPQKPTESSNSLIIDSTDDDDIMPVAKQPSPSTGIKIVSTNTLSRDAAKATLIICPLSVMSNWTDQICTHVNPAVSLRVYLYYGSQRITDVEYLKKQDIILTTYPTIANDYWKMVQSPLYKIKWLRIILDEGHTIRNQRTSLSKSVLQLESERRWVITGTPIQNRIEDLWVLLLFLRLEPFNDKKWWKTMIANILQNRGRLAEIADFRLNALIKHISIRRLKDEKIDDKKIVELPPKHVVIQDITLSDEERKVYDMMQLAGQKAVRRYIREDSVLKHYGHCFLIIMRLRQMCLYPKLCKKDLVDMQMAVEESEREEGNNEGNSQENIDESNEHLIQILIEAMQAGDSEECAICLETLKDPVITMCAHVFCFPCIKDVLQSEGLAPTCPMCRGPICESELVRVPEERLKNINAEENDDSEKEGAFESSAKIKELISSLEVIRDKDPSIKSVVVSQFTSFHNVVGKFLDRHGFQYLRLDGTMNITQRTKALEDFNDNPSATIFLLSTTAGGTGISLTAASRVFLMDPAWNPAVEEQCFDRCHRLGQTKEVIITKYIVMNSIEERMLTLQEEKRALMTDAFGAKAQSEEDRRRTRVRDIAHLMGLQAPRPAANANPYIRV